MPSITSNLLNTGDTIAANLQPLEPYFAKAKVHVSCLGSRIVQFANGYEIPLDNLSKKVLEASSKILKKGDTLQKRISGSNIAEKITSLYDLSDKELNKKNALTRAITWAREFSLIPYTQRFLFTEHCKNNFLAFPQKEFLHLFGGNFKKRHPDCAFSTGIDGMGIIMYVAKKESVLRKLNRPWWWPF